MLKLPVVDKIGLPWGPLESRDDAHGLSRVFPLVSDVWLSSTAPIINLSHTVDILLRGATLDSWPYFLCTPDLHRPHWLAGHAFSDLLLCLLIWGSNCSTCKLRRLSSCAHLPPILCRPTEPICQSGKFPRFWVSNPQSRTDIDMSRDIFPQIFLPLAHPF